MSNVAMFNQGALRNSLPAQPDAVQQLADRVSSQLNDLQKEIQRAMASGSNGFGCASDETLSISLPGRTDLSMDTNLQMDVRRARKLRQLRRRIFGKDKFSGPGWDILLHLFDSHISQLSDTVGNVCHGAEIPCATVVRWLSRLEQEHLVLMTDDRFDGRRRFVKLTDAGVQLMSSYFAGAAPHQITA